MLITIVYGLLRFVTGTLPSTPVPAQSTTLEAVGVFILLRAFSAGCTALTGLEAISDGVKAFKSPESAGAAKTILRLSVILIVILLGITFLAFQIGIVPRVDETVVSQMAKTLFGINPMYYAFQIGTFLILFLAANTPFADFPRLASIQARDGYLPRQFSNMGSKLVFSQGIISLSAVSILLLVASGGYVHSLIPIYAVGVFLCFSLTQLGMFVHHLKIIQNPGAHKPSYKSLYTNGLGFVATTIVFIIVLYTKFFEGAYIILPMIGLIFFANKRIKNHYIRVDQALSISETQLFNNPNEDILAVILVSKLDRRAVEGARVAMGLNPMKTCALHVAFDKEEGDRLKTIWDALFYDIPLEVRVDEFREVIPPILEYFALMEQRWIGKIVAVVPMLVSQQPFTEFLHNQTATKIIEATRKDPRNSVEIYEVPVKVDTKQKPK